MEALQDAQTAPVRPRLSALRSFIARTLETSNFGFIPGKEMLRDLQQAKGFSSSHLDDFCESWGDLQLDAYMGDGGKYRRRRHATMSAAAGGRTIKMEPHQPHFQALTYNTLNGDIAREYEPIRSDIAQGPVMTGLVELCGQVFGSLQPDAKWHIEVHQFHIDAMIDGGKPTPEGIHRDGVSFVLMTMIERYNIKDGRTSLFDKTGSPLAEFTLMRPFDTAIINDEELRHGVTPIFRDNPENPGHRDVLVVTFAKR